MSSRQWKRLEAVRRVEAGEMTMRQASSFVRLSERQMRRLRRAVAARGQQAVVHGNTGRAPWNRLDEELRKRVLQLALGKYVGFNDQHLTEKLATSEALDVSRQSVRRILREAGVGAVRRRRCRQHHRRRDRKAQEGLMVLWDGSRHDWLEGRGPVLSLMGGIDDATGRLLPGAHFVEQECAAGYLRLLHAIVSELGVPWSIYMDRHGSLKRTDDHWTLEEELRGRQDPTHVGASLEELEIEAIYALSPQAKGRVERLWGTLQDRLTSELRLAGARTLVEANAVLKRYIGEHNIRFAVKPAETSCAWRAVRAGTDVDRVCAFRYPAQVQNDNTVRFAGLVIDIPPGPGRRSYAHARVDVRQLLDGSWRVYFDGQVIATREATALESVRPRPFHKRSAAERAFGRQVKALTISTTQPCNAGASKKRSRPQRSPPPPVGATRQLVNRKRRAA